MVGAGFGQDEDAQAGAGQLVGVEGDVVVAPGDHHDGGLQGQLQGRLGQHAQGVEDSGPCKGFKSESKIKVNQALSFEPSGKLVMAF